MPNSFDFSNLEYWYDHQDQGHLKIKVISRSGHFEVFPESNCKCWIAKRVVDFHPNAFLFYFLFHFACPVLFFVIFFSNCDGKYDLTLSP